MFHARDVSTWLSALILVTSASGCSLEDRAASRFVVPTLRDNGQVLATRVRARSATFGPWTVRRVTGESGDESVVPRASFETGAPGAPVQHDTVRFTLERVEDGDASPVALVSCDAARRRGLDADLASVGEDPGGEVAIRCDAAMEGRAFSLRAEGDLSGNLRGSWRRIPQREVARAPGGGTAPEAGDPDASSGDGSLEVLLHHRMWQAIPMRTPAPVVQLYDAKSREVPDGRRAIAATVLGGRGPTWMHRDLTDFEAQVAAAWVGAFLLLDVPWEQAT